MFFTQPKSPSSKDPWSALSVPIPTKYLTHQYDNKPLQFVQYGLHEEMNVGEEQGAKELLNSRNRQQIFVNGQALLPLLDKIEMFDETSPAELKETTINTIKKILSAQIKDPKIVNLIIRNIDQYYFGMAETLLMPLLDEGQYISGKHTDREIYFDCNASTEHQLRIRILAKNITASNPTDGSTMALGDLGVELLQSGKSIKGIDFTVHIATTDNSSKIIELLLGKKNIAKVAQFLQNHLIKHAEAIVDYQKQVKIPADYFQTLEAKIRTNDASSADNYLTLNQYFNRIKSDLYQPLLNNLSDLIEKLDKKLNPLLQDPFVEIDKIEQKADVENLKQIKEYQSSIKTLLESTDPIIQLSTDDLIKIHEDIRRVNKTLEPPSPRSSLKRT